MDKDMVKKLCLADDARYADLINGLLCEGKQKVQANDLIEMDTQSVFKIWLYPCITIVLYYGEHWDGSKDLQGILDLSEIPEELRKYISNYLIHVFEIQKIENTEVFRTDLKQIFNFLRYSKDKNKLKVLVQSDEAYQEMEEDAYDMIAVCTNTEELLSVKKYRGKDGKINMCQAIKEMLEDEWNAGEKIGIEKGIEKGIEVFILDKLEDKTPRDIIVGKLQMGFHLSEEKAKEYVDNYIVN